MRTCFQRTEAVLNAVGSSLPPSGQADVAAALTTLRGGYRSLGRSSLPPIDYSSVSTQAAYAYGYMTANADLIYQSLSLDVGHTKAVLDRPTGRIVSVGGGPGTELIGFYKFIERLSCSCSSLEYVALDHHPAWAAMTSDVISTQPSTVSTISSHVTAALHAPLPAAAINSIASADFLTFSYSLSESWRYDSTGMITAGVDQMLTILKPGALIIYSDNGGSSFDGPFEKNFCSRTDVALLGRDRLSQMVGNDEDKGPLDQWRAWINNGFPKLKGDATIALMEKR